MGAWHDSLVGNPYCDNSTVKESDLTRCVCWQQVCVDTRKHIAETPTLIQNVFLGKQR